MTIADQNDKKQEKCPYCRGKVGGCEKCKHTGIIQIEDVLDLLKIIHKILTLFLRWFVFRCGRINRLQEIVLDTYISSISIIIHKRVLC